MKKEIFLPIKNQYVCTLMDIFNEYLIREFGYGLMMPEGYLKKQIEAARTVHFKQRNDILKKTKIYGLKDLTGSNTTIVFVNENGDPINRISTLKKYI